MKKTLLSALLMLLLFVAFSGVAMAHVAVYPKETTQGSYEVFTVRVPTEKAAATVKVEVKVPAEVEVSRVEPKPEWTYDLVKDGSGKVTAVVWTAAGKGLGQTEFGEFRMQGKVADNATSLTWKAAQTYADNSVVDWAGDAKSEKPASVTTVKASAAGTGTDSHGNTNAGDAGTAAAGKNDAALPLYLSIAALAVAALSLFVNLAKKKR